VNQRVVVCALLISLFAACHRDNGGGIGAVPGGFPPKSSPVQVSSSEQVVKVTTLAAQVAAGGASEATIQLAIMPGYHINANPATFPYLIATEVVPERAEGIVAGKPVYPAGEKRNFQFEKQPLAVYQGETQIKIPINADAKATAGQRSLPISVKVQACDDEKCFPPASINATIPIEVK
jgi:hypothetical protein